MSGGNSGSEDFRIFACDISGPKRSHWQLTYRQLIIPLIHVEGLEPGIESNFFRQFADLFFTNQQLTPLDFVTPFKRAASFFEYREVPCGDFA